jgi:hypothetical protein
MYSAMEAAVMSTVADQRTLNCEVALDTSIRYPMPFPVANHSDNRAPNTALGAAIRADARRPGTAKGSRAFLSTLQRVAPYETITSSKPIASSFIDVLTFTNVGKNVITETKTITERSPLPNVSVTKGIMATRGTDLIAIDIGNIVRSTVGERTINTEASTAANVPTR